MRAFAAAQGFIIVSKDSDFDDLARLRGAPPKVVWIRRGNCPTDTIEAIPRRHYRDIERFAQDAEAAVLMLW